MAKAIRYSTLIALIASLCISSFAADDYYLVAGAFRQEKNANHFSERLAELTQQHVLVKSILQQDKTLYSVQIDELKNKSQANALQTKLKAEGIKANLRHHKPQLANLDIKAQPPTGTLHSKKQTLPRPAPAKKASHVTIAPKPLTQSSVSQKPQQAPRAGANKIKPAPKRLWNLRKVDIRSVITEISRETGKNFLVDPRVQGKITIIASTPMSPREIYPVFLAALQVSGYSAIPSGHIIKIVPNIDSNSLSSPLASSVRPGIGDENVVRVIPIKFVNAQQLVPMLRPLMPQWSKISAYQPSNMIILSGHANNLQRLADIISHVDTASHDGVDVIHLRHATAQEVVKTIKALQGPQQAGRRLISFAADDRSNAVLISGNNAARLRMRILVSELDAPSPGSEGDSQIIQLEYMQAKDMLPILAGVAKSHYNGPVETVMGTRTITRLDMPSGDGAQTYPSADRGAAATSSTSTSQKGAASGQRIIEIIGEPNTNSIILNAPPALRRILRNIIRKIDVRPAQVAIEALIAEIDQDYDHELGVVWGSRGNFLGADRKEPFIAGFGIISSSQVSRFEAQIHALVKNNKTDILSTPSVVVLDNHLAEIQVGREVSIATTTFPNNAGGTTGATPYTTLGRKKAALILKVTPQVGHDGSIKMNIIQKKDTVLPVPTGGDPNSPPFNISQISTSVIIDDGDILVFGGLIDNNLTQTDTSIPILGDIPIIGRLFHNIKNTRKKNKLMVFLHPVILHNPHESNLLTEKKYNKIRLQQLRSLAQYPYFDGLDENILPVIGDPELPEPFSEPNHKADYKGYFQHHAKH